MVKELIVPIALGAALGSMLLPLPPGVLDFLLIGNLVLALMLLVSALYVTDSLKLSSLPTLLLLATLFRLSLNIATTRSILGRGEAGKAIEAFGGIVIEGNLLVGVVVFLVITLIQFIVIAKGSERVAEVAARFTLDALPGKQMAIDADLRAGLIDIEGARQRRSDMQMESRFYGALDGAMKFVKGDAIAGIVIVAINIIVGFFIGIMGEGLTLQESLNKYSLLTIGDGLISQIPALMNALAAGLVVTRVSKGDETTLAHDLVSQVGQIRKAKIFIIVISIALAFIPGMPALPFVSIAVMLMVSIFLKPAASAAHSSQPELQRLKPPPPLQVLVARSSAPAFSDSAQLIKSVTEFRDKVYAKFGIVLGLPDFKISDELEQGITVFLRGVPVKTDGSINSIDQAMQILLNLVAQNALELIDDTLTRRTLDLLEKDAPELVATVVPGVISVTQLTEILKGLMREGISIKNFDIILQAVAEFGSKSTNDRILLAEVRIALKRIICFQFAPQGTLPAYLLDPLLDVMISQTERDQQQLDPTIIQKVSDQLKLLDPLVVLCSRSSRPLLSECLRLRGNKNQILAHEEILSETQIEWKGKLEIPEENEIIDLLAA